jgi:hypothetical protein
VERLRFLYCLDNWKPVINKAMTLGYKNKNNRKETDDTKRENTRTFKENE